MANRPEATRNITTFAVSSERTRKIDKRTSGSAERSSMIRNEAKRSPASTQNAIRRPEPPPVSFGAQVLKTEPNRPAGDGARAAHVVAAMRVLVLRLGHEPQREEE